MRWPGAGARLPSVILQEYVPREHAEDWIVHLYCDANSNCLVEFTGVKVRSWPPHAGMTACAYAVPNPGLAAMAERFCEQIGFHGIADLDWRFDRRDGQYKLVDFNPRVGRTVPALRDRRGNRRRPGASSRSHRPPGARQAVSSTGAG